MEKSILYTKSYDLAVSALKFVAQRQKKGSEQALAWWLGCISEIGANLYLAQESHSASNLSIKLYTARKACNRSMFATLLGRDSELFTEEESEKFTTEITELIKIIQASISTIFEKRSKTASVKENTEE